MSLAGWPGGRIFALTRDVNGLSGFCFCCRCRSARPATAGGSGFSLPLSPRKMGSRWVSVFQKIFRSHQRWGFSSVVYVGVSPPLAQLVKAQLQNYTVLKMAGLES